MYFRLDLDVFSTAILYELVQNDLSVSTVKKVNIFLNDYADMYAWLKGIFRRSANLLYLQFHSPLTKSNFNVLVAAEWRLLAFHGIKIVHQLNGSIFFILICPDMKIELKNFKIFS